MTLRTEHIFVIRRCIKIKGQVSREYNWFNQKSPLAHEFNISFYTKYIGDTCI